MSKSDPLNGELPSYFELCSIYVRPNVFIQGCLCCCSNKVFFGKKEKGKIIYTVAGWVKTWIIAVKTVGVVYFELMV